MDVKGGNQKKKEGPMGSLPQKKIETRNNSRLLVYQGWGVDKGRRVRKEEQSLGFCFISMSSFVMIRRRRTGGTTWEKGRARVRHGLSLNSIEGRRKKRRGLFLKKEGGGGRRDNPDAK